MEDKKIELELLSPAANFSSGRLAILAGADAVYIGGPKFGARVAAANSWSEIEKLVKFAHQYYAKVYLALNTIFFDEEINDVKDSIWKAYDLGVDAIIIQDMSIFELDLPPIPVFASTQTHNYNLQQIKFLESVGVSRIILARELSLEAIKEISSAVKTDLECFVHGSLCVSFSGRCYLSQFLSGRSANRGACQQACRLPFSLVDAKGKELFNDKYLLSPKDLNLIKALPDLVEAGVKSFKIEGRLKDPVYVTNVTAKYRLELDRIIAESGGKFKRASAGSSTLDFEPDLAKTFNRGYSEGFLYGRKQDFISPDNQKSLGKIIGKVKRVDHRYFTLDRPFSLSNGDGLCWFNSRGMLNGTNVNLISSDGKIYPNKWIPLKPGTFIYCNQDQAFEKSVMGGVSREISFNLDISEQGIKATDENGNISEIDFGGDKTLAQKAKQAQENWKTALSKSGEAIFKLNNITFNWEQPLFAPLSLINEYRRKLLADLMIKRLENYPRLSKEITKTSHQYPVNNLDYSYNVANKLAVDFYLHHGAKVEELALEKKSITTKPIKLMTTKHCLKHFLNACPKHSKGVVEKISEPLFLVYNNRKFRLHFNCADCVMDVWSV